MSNGNPIDFDSLHQHAKRPDTRKPKQERYKNTQNRDWIDECADELTPEEFRGAMKFTIGKYIKRIGKKDAIELELYKIADYCDRWSEYESKLKGKNE